MDPIERYLNSPPYLERTRRSDDGRFDDLFRTCDEQLRQLYGEELSRENIMRVYEAVLYIAGGSIVHDEGDEQRVRNAFQMIMNDNGRLRSIADTTLFRLSLDEQKRESERLLREMRALFDEYDRDSAV
ncbi:MAG TPA: hypothetical protein VHA78_04600 [Candidatus Peribacteraceae bacterium]|nr:hypothetical protein [Candidatus Peribacteraceae bacterium]